MGHGSRGKRLKALANEILSHEAAIEHLVDLADNDMAMIDHVVAVTGATLVEIALEAAIVSRLTLTSDERKRLFKYDYKGPLSDMNSKIRIGKALSLFGPLTTIDLESIRVIRNAFAHSLRYIGFWYSDEVKELLGFHVCQIGSPFAAKFRNPEWGRAKYADACIIIASTLRSDIETRATQDSQPVLSQLP